MPPAVLAEQLVKVYPARRGSNEVRALDGVSLSVQPGTVLGLLGPNGAGKTTTVRVLTTLLKPDSGRALVGGHDVVHDPEAVRRSIGLAGQNAAVDERLTGAENLTLVGRLNHLDRATYKARTTQLLEQFKLTEAGGRRLSTYSGGMRRRLDLAAALVTRPPVLFLDEPTTGLDPASRNDMWEVIGELVREGTTVLLTTQYLEEADRLANTVVVVDTGKVIAEGTPTELKARLGATVVEVTLADPGEASRAGVALTPITGERPVVEGSVVRASLPGGAAQLVDVVRALDAATLVPHGLVLREPSLDDVFLQLTGHTTEATA